MACSVKQRNSRVGNRAVGAILEVEFCLAPVVYVAQVMEYVQGLRAGGCCEKPAV